MTETDPRHLRLVEAMLFASADPVSEKALAGRLPDGVDVVALLKELQAMYADRGVTLNRAGRTWAFRTAPDLAQMMNVEVKVPRKLSRAAVETLAIIAYHQPVTRAEIEEIRGVGLSKGTLDVLLEAGWIRPRGRKKAPGRPVTWGTSDAFLDHFGIEDVNDLPGMEELKAAGLLDASPAISAFQGKMSNDGDGEADDADQGQMSLVEGGNDDPEAIKDMLEPLDPEDGDTERP
ncbi:MAG TPA: SMC-Scp complex subunit ScpB [Rhodospirillales bacterium]